MRDGCGHFTGSGVCGIPHPASASPDREHLLLRPSSFVQTCMLDAALTIEHRGSRVPGSGDVYLRSYRGHVNVSFFIPYYGVCPEA